MLAEGWKVLPDIPEIRFSAGNHQYRVEGIKRAIPSVTTILNNLNKPALLPWVAKITAEYVLKQWASGKEYSLEDIQDVYGKAKALHKQEATKAGDIGTAIHGAVEQWAQYWAENGDDWNAFVKKEYKNPEYSWPAGTKRIGKRAFNSFLEWIEDSGIESIIGSEVRIYHPEVGYCGCLDLLCFKGGKVYVIDVKSGKTIYEPEQPMQIAAYAAAISRMLRLKVEGIGILRLDKETGVADWQDYSALQEEYWQMFLELCNFEIKKRKVRSLQKEEEKK